MLLGDANKIFNSTLPSGFRKVETMGPFYSRAGIQAWSILHHLTSPPSVGNMSWRENLGETSTNNDMIRAANQRHSKLQIGFVPRRWTRKRKQHSRGQWNKRIHHWAPSTKSCLNLSSNTALGTFIPSKTAKAQ